MRRVGKGLVAETPLTCKKETKNWNIRELKDAMKIICPKCSQSIAANYLNKSQGIAYCKYCSDYFMLDDHLRRSPYQIKREKRFTNTSKPSKTKIKIKDTPHGVTINFPDRLPLIVRVCLMLFFGAIAYFIYLTIFNVETLNAGFYLKIGILIILEFLLIIVIVLKGPETMLKISGDIVQLNRKRYALPSYFRSRKTNDLDTIDVYYDSDHEGGSDSGIEMNFDKESKLRFGHNLRHNEQNWLAGQLIQIRDNLTLDHKVTKDLEANLARAKTNPMIVNTVKPINSGIQSFNQSNYFSLVIPKDRKTGNALGILIVYLIGVSIFGIAAIGFWGFLPPFEYHKVMKYVFSVFTLLAAYGLFYYLYTFIYRAEHEVLISPTEVRIKLQPFGVSLEKNRPTKALTDITKSREWNCILLKFKGHKNLRVGFLLTKDEITFLIGELKRSVNEVNSQVISNR